MESRVLGAIQECQKEMKLKDDLGMDSLASVELVMFLEDEFATEIATEIADEVAEKWVTIGDVVSYMVNRE